MPDLKPQRKGLPKVRGVGRVWELEGFHVKHVERATLQQLLEVPRLRMLRRSASVCEAMAGRCCAGVEGVHDVEVSRRGRSEPLVTESWTT